MPNHINGILILKNNNESRNDFDNRDGENGNNPINWNGDKFFDKNVL